MRVYSLHFRHNYPYIFSAFGGSDSSSLLDGHDICEGMTYIADATYPFRQIYVLDGVISIHTKPFNAAVDLPHNHVYIHNLLTINLKV